MKPLDLIGQRFGRLLVIARGPNTARGNTRWVCVCICENETLVPTTPLKNGSTRSCGCLHRECAGNLQRTHGLSKSPEYRIFAGIKARCTNTQNHSYKYYGARGIQCFWESFEEFLADMGQRPTPQHTIDRIDTNGPYSKDNCRWATRKEQSRNTRKNRHVIYLGQRMTLSEADEATGSAAGHTRYREEHGISLEAPRDSRRSNRMVAYQGKWLTITHVARLLGLTRHAIDYRLRHGLPLE